jgi:amino acid adenylation domain-containing protein
VPFEKLVEELEPERSLSRSPLFQAMLVLQNLPPEGGELEGLRLRSWGGEGGGESLAKFDLTLALEEARAGLIGSLEHNADLFDGVTVERWCGHLIRLLAGAVAEPSRRLADLPLWSEAEHHQLLWEWNARPYEPPVPACLHELVFAQAVRTPDAVAVAHARESLTYGELVRRARRLARRLQALGVGPESRVGILLERNPEMVVSLLATLAAGGAYVPLDPVYPQDRLALLLEDSGASVLLTHSDLAAKLPARPGITRICLDVERDLPADDLPLLGGASPRNLAYLIYTSGSTGRPKGVGIEHRSAVALLEWSWQTFSDAEMAGVLASTSICFDMSVFELFGTLSRGGRIILVRDALELPAVADLDVRLINTVPSAVSELLRLDGLPASVRTVNLGGEPLRSSLVDALYRQPGVARVTNLYGPSEDTTYSTVLEAVRDQEGEPGIGVPLPGTSAYVVDADLREMPVGVPGELYLGGAGLARGYLDRPELTAERFLPDPFGGAPGERLYRTGDRVRWRPEGTLEFLGRLDHQVKVRGFRVELGEIEVALQSLPGVREAAVIAREDTPGDRRLVGYVAGDLSAAQLRDSLRHRLPEYMVPSALVVLASLPLTPNGKVDRKALPRPESSGRALSAAPRDDWELGIARIWEDLLDVRPVGIHDDFFSLGGHSLLALRLVARVRSQLGRELQPATLFASPTVAELARHLRAEAPPELRPSLVELQPGRGLAPLFCVHPIGGEVFCYLDLVRALGEERPAYGLRAPGPESGEPLREIERMASRYVALIREIQPAGPYHLLGWSMGGLIAFEMARQLRREGQEVALLALVDSYLAPEGPAPTAVERIASFARDLFGLSGRDLPLPAAGDPLWSSGEEELLSLLYGRARDAGILPPDLDYAELQRSFAVFSANLDAMYGYVAQPYDGPALLVRPASRAGGSDDPAAAWLPLVRTLEVFSCPGDHYSLLRLPAVLQIAEALALGTIQE